MPLWLAPALGSLVGGALGAIGQSSANESNQQIAQWQMAFNREEAQKNRDFQETMSRNSYRYGMEDMQKAGLNPMLAFSQGGASTPSGAQATAGSQPRMENELAGLSSSAMDAIRAYRELEQAEVAMDNTEADTRQKQKDMELKDQEIQLKKAQEQTEAFQQRLMDANARQSNASSKELYGRFESIMEDIKESRNRQDRYSIERDQYKSDTDYNIKRREVDKKFIWIDKMLEKLGLGASTARDIGETVNKMPKRDKRGRLGF